MGTRKGMGTRKETEDQIKRGSRDPLGAKIIPTRARFQKAEPTNGDEMRAIYALAIKNMQNRRGGNKPKYADLDELQEAIMAYWEYLDVQMQEGVEVMPDVEGLCTFLGINRATLNRWEQEDYQGYGETIAQAKNDIASGKKQLAMRGRIAPLFAVADFNNNHGYTQKQEMVVTPNNPLGEQKATPQIMEKYMDLIEEEPKDALPPAETEDNG